MIDQSHVEAVRLVLTGYELAVSRVPYLQESQDRQTMWGILDTVTQWAERDARWSRGHVCPWLAEEFAQEIQQFDASTD